MATFDRSIFTGDFRSFYTGVHICRQMLTSFAHGLVDRMVILAGDAGVELVEPITDSSKVMVDAVRINGIVVVVNRDIPNIVLSQGKVSLRSD